jgi:hypothetical protein
MSQPNHMITPVSTMPTAAKTQTSASSLKRERLGSAGPVTITSSFMSGICRRNRKSLGSELTLNGGGGRSPDKAIAEKRFFS